MNVDAVFEGGGVKGIALLGAAAAVAEAGYTFHSLAGTSAGAILAALLAAGYTPAELVPLFRTLDYTAFQDNTGLGRIPLLGPDLEMFRTLGLYRGDAFLAQMRQWLSARTGRAPLRFGDLVLDPAATESRYRYRLHVVASDVSRGRMLVLPEDAASFGVAPDDLEVALAVRMSMAIPFYFRPVILDDPAGHPCTIVDGGLLSNFPLELFDTPPGVVPAWPTFGFSQINPVAAPPQRIRDPASLLWAMFNAAMEAHDAHYLAQPDVAARTIAIDGLGIAATQFDLPQSQRDRLCASGRTAAAQFLATWDFPRYIARFRSEAGDQRRPPPKITTP